MTSILKYNGALVICGTGAFVKGMDCTYVSFPQANDWNWEVVEERNGAWTGLNGNSPSFQWTACGSGSDSEDGTNCCGGDADGEDFYGEIRTTIVVFCSIRLLLEVSGDVERMDPGFDAGYFILLQEGVGVYEYLISGIGDGTLCSMVQQTGTNGVDVDCCGKLSLVCDAGDSNHHTPGSHSWVIDYQ